MVSPDVTVIFREKLLIARFKEQIQNCLSEQSNSYCQFGKENQIEGQTAGKDFLVLHLQ